MRFITHRLDKKYTYPCSKSDVKAAFGLDLIGGVYYGLWPVFDLRRAKTHNSKIQDTVLLALRINETPEVIRYLGRASLDVYRVIKEDFGEGKREAMAEHMRCNMRPWLEARLNRSETESFGPTELLVELRGGRLVLHETRWS